VVTIIPARGGSKGLPGKNIRMFCGKPLLAWSILQAPEPVYVSSDDDEILAVAREYGATGIKRPPELATDTASSESALLHALDTIGDVDKVVFLQPTSPLRWHTDAVRAIKLFDDSGADSLFSCCELEDFCAWTEDNGTLRGLTFDPFNRGRRQDRKPIHLENGSIYIFKPEVLRKGNRLGGKVVRYPMQYWQSFEIDDQETFDLCRFYFRRKELDL
jgi:N-acylneuraminate cytidylyltransferase